MGERLKVPASALRPGDQLVPTGTTIIGPPQKGVRTPPGKVEIRVRRANGTLRDVVWNGSTLITIIRREEV